MLPILPLSPFAPGTSRSDQNNERLGQLRALLGDYQFQLTTGKRSSTFGGLGTQRITSIDSRARITQLSAFTAVIDQGVTRTQLVTNIVNRVGRATDETKEVLLQSTSTPDDTTIAIGQQRIRGKFDEILNLFNEGGDGLYLFSGRTRDVKPVVETDQIINGNGVQDGLRQLINERRQADLGVAGTGRLNVTLAGATVSLTEQAVGLPFGIKLTSPTTGAISGLTVTGPAGAPPNIDFTFAALPVDGERLTVRLDLPGGDQATFDIVAGSLGATGADASFPIGATPAANAANLQTALQAKIQEIAASQLEAASALQAAKDFFSGSVNNPPPRVAGPPFNTSVAFAAPGTRPTVIWYQGDDDATIAARDTAVAQVDGSLRLGIGARANEAAFVKALAALGSIVADTFTPGLPTTSAKYVAAAKQVLGEIGNPGGTQEIFRIEAEFGAAEKTAREIKDRHEGTKTLLETIVSGVEDASVEEVSATLLSLQTRLEVSYQTTALISRLSLTNFI